MKPEDFLKNLADGAKFTYDEEVDCGYIYLNWLGNKIHSTKQIKKNILIDLSEGGDIIGMEFLDLKGLLKNDN